jgi:hypothetical protein
MRSILSVLLAATAVVAQAPDSSLITISAATFSGNGCPQGTVSTSVSPDKTVITFGFDAFQAYIGPGTAVQDRTKNCQLHLNLKYPSGYSFAVVESTYHGFAMLDSGVKASFLSTYYYSQDAANTATTRTDLTGGGIWAEGQVYTKNDIVPQDNIVKAPCGSTSILNVNNRLLLTSSNSRASGMITDDDATVDISQQINIKWFKC